MTLIFLMLLSQLVLLVMTLNPEPVEDEVEPGEISEEDTSK